MGTCEGKLEGASQDGSAAEGDAVDLTVAIVSARGLRNADYIGKSDCFTILKVSGKSAELHRTKVKDDTLDPVWKEEAVVQGFNLGGSLEFLCYDADLLGMKDSLGQAKLAGSLFAKEGYNGELKLENAGEGIMAYLRVKVKRQDQMDYPPGPAPEVKITLQRESPDVRWGMDMDAQDGKHLHVASVEAKGLVWDYNASVEDPALQLRPGDYIVSINSSEGDAIQLRDLIKNESKMDLVVRHASEFHALATVTRQATSAKQQKTGCFPGLVLRETLKGSCLVVQEVTEDWKPNSQERQVQPFDRIVAVGDTRGSAKLLLKALQKSNGSVQVTFSRAANLLNPC